MSIALGITFSGAASAATLSVGPGATYMSIGEAVTAASKGDRIEVYAGEYDERPLRIGFDLDIVALAGPVATVWRTDQAGQAVVRVTDEAEVTLSGFTLEPAEGGLGVVVDASTLVGAGLVVEGAGASAIVGNAAVISLEGCAFDAGVAVDGGHIDVEDSELTVTFSDLTNGSATRGGAIAAVDSAVVVQYSLIEGNEATDAGGALYVDGGTLDVLGCTFYSNSVTRNFDANGGGIHVRGAGTAFVEASTFEGNFAVSRGGAMHLFEDATATIDACTFLTNESAFGGALYSASAANVEVIASTFTSNAATAGNGGAIRVRPDVGDPTLTVLTSSFRGNSASGNGGAIAMNTPTGAASGIAVFDEVAFTANSAGTGGAMNLATPELISAAHLLLCANRAEDAGGIRVGAEAGADGNSWTNSVFTSNVATGAGGALFFDGSGRAYVANDTFLANVAAEGLGGAVRIDGASAALVNDLVAYTGGGDGISVGSSNRTTVDYSAFFANTGVDLPSAVVGAGLVFADPQLVSFTDDGGCADDLVAPAYGSPLIDAGDPAILDPDGTRSDIGATGGPAADPDSLSDLDGDGVIGAVDCDDANPAIRPGAEEVCNGVDDDCDGTVDLHALDPSVFYLDEDGDGYGSDVSIEACNPPAHVASESGDCDDRDADVFPGQLEVCDGVDQNCNGAVDEESGDPWWPDWDRDGFGDASAPASFDCPRPETAVDNWLDCDDTSSAVYPGGIDLPGDGVDGDCDGIDPSRSVEALRVRGGCGCGSGSGGRGWLPIASLALAAIGRRPRRRTAG